MSTGTQVIQCPICEVGHLSQHCEGSDTCEWLQCKTKPSQPGCGAVLDIAARRGFRQMSGGKYQRLDLRETA